MLNRCPLCQSSEIDSYAQDKKRRYFHCHHCDLVFADPASWPTVAAEKAEYDLHENNVADPGYNRFLQRIVEPLAQRLPTHAEILDFGCGPAPALAAQLEALGFRLYLYDIFYHRDESVLSHRVDAVVMTEVIEHLHEPLPLLQQRWAQLKSGGVLAIMTQRVIDQARFQHWQYKNDPTHCCFYSEQSFQWLGDTLGALTLEFAGRDMVFLRKS